MMNTKDRPNIILLVMDTARADTVLTNDKPEFPTLSSLAAKGDCFTNAYADAPWTLPSHASLFTGTSPSFHGTNATHKYLDGDIRTLPETLSNSGYYTVSVTNNAWVTGEFGLDRGFDVEYKTWQYYQSDIDIGPISLKESGNEFVINAARQILQGNPIKNIVNALYGRFIYRKNDYGAVRTNAIVQKVLSNTSEPFFLFLNYLEPHLKYQPPSEFATEYLDCSYTEAMDVPQNPWKFICGSEELSERELQILQNLYKAEIAYLDHQIEEVIDNLKRNDQWDNTLFFIIGDHGENIGEHGLMDHQYALYDTLIHVPLIISGGAFESHGTFDRLVQLSDIYPTLYDLLELDDEEAADQFQGQSFLIDKPEREVTISEYMAPQPPISVLKERAGKASSQVESYDRRLRAIRTKSWKLIRGSDGTRELYDLEADPDEKQNIAEQKQDIVQDLEDRLNNWLEEFSKSQKNEEPEISDGARRRLSKLGYL